MTSSVVWRCIAAAVVAVLVAVGVRAFFGDDGGRDIREIASDEAAIDPEDALARAPAGKVIAVRGFVYDDGSFVQLCDGLTGDDPPRCVGPSLLVKNLDLARLALEEAEIDGVSVLYTDEPIVLGGTVLGADITVTEVLSS